MISIYDFCLRYRVLYTGLHESIAVGVSAILAPTPVPTTRPRRQPLVGCHWGAALHLSSLASRAAVPDS